MEYSAGKFFHLMRYSEIDRFRSHRVLASVTAPGSNMMFPSYLSSGKIVWIGIFCNFWISSHSFGHMDICKVLCLDENFLESNE